MSSYLDKLEARFEEGLPAKWGSFDDGISYQEVRHLISLIRDAPGECAFESASLGACRSDERWRNRPEAWCPWCLWSERRDRGPEEEIYHGDG